ncbi:hypothetical protein ACFE04_000676 [Oxalis oulophora]
MAAAVLTILQKIPCLFDSRQIYSGWHRFVIWALFVVSVVVYGTLSWVSLLWGWHFHLVDRAHIRAYALSFFLYALVCICIHEWRQIYAYAHKQPVPHLLRDSMVMLWGSNLVLVACFLCTCQLHHVIYSKKKFTNSTSTPSMSSSKPAPN